MRYFKWALVIVLLLTSTAILAEVFFRALLSEQQRRDGPAAEWRAMFGSIGANSIKNGNTCLFLEMIGPHPQLGYAFTEDSPCSVPATNNSGTSSRWSVGKEKNRNFFVIAVVGGSVAADLALGPPKSGISWIEEALNSSFTSPDGRPFRIVSGALGGWNYPSQITFLSLYGHALDAVIAIDGQNEASRASAGDSIDSPDLTYWMASPDHSRWKLVIIVRGMASIRRLIESNPILNRSWLLLHAFRASLNKIVSSDLWSTSLKRKEQLYGLPKEWGQEKIHSWNSDRYGRYLRTLKAVSQSNEILHAHFLQPTAFIGWPSFERELSEEELQLRKIILLFEQQSRLARKTGVNTESLLSIFKNEGAGIYSDQVHCAYDAKGNNHGYQIMGQRIAVSLARFWNLKRKNVSAIDRSWTKQRLFSTSKQPGTPPISVPWSDLSK